MHKTSNTKTASVNVRLYPEIKEQAENVFAYHGLTLAEAITVFINHACHAGGFPFELKGARWQDPLSLAALEESERMEADAGAYKSFMSAEELFDCLDGDDDI